MAARTHSSLRKAVTPNLRTPENKVSDAEFLAAHKSSMTLLRQAVLNLAKR